VEAREDNTLRSGAKKKGGIGLTYWSIMEAIGVIFVQNVESFETV